MNKAIAFAILILCASFVFTACTQSNAIKDNSPNSQITDEQTANSTSSNDTIGTNLNTAGGNSSTTNYIEVTVSEDKYFYVNHEIPYDDLIKVLDSLDVNTVVKISDENATLKAYKNLTGALEKRGILFEAAN